MVSGKKANDLSNGTAKYRDQPNMFSRKDNGAGGSGKGDGRSQNGMSAI